MGLDAEEFKKAFKETLSDPDIIELFRGTFKAVVKVEADDLRKEIGTLRDLLVSKETRIKKLEERVELLESSHDDLEQYSGLRNSIRISGIPETNDEDIQARVFDLFQHKMGVDTSITDIDRMHRGGRRGDRPRSVLVKFATYRARKAVFQAKRFLRPGAPRPTSMDGGGCYWPERTGSS